MEELINKAKDYFRSLNIENGLYKVIIQLPKSWGILESPDENLKIELIDSKSNRYIIIGDMNEVNLDTIFNHIDFIVQNNIEVEKKKALFQEKSKELINLFSDYSLDDLQTLEFKLHPKQKRGRKSKDKTIEDKKELSNLSPIIESKVKKEDNITYTESNGDTVILKEEDIEKLGF